MNFTELICVKIQEQPIISIRRSWLRFFNYKSLLPDLNFNNVKLNKENPAYMGDTDSLDLCG